MQAGSLPLLIHSMHTCTTRPGSPGAAGLTLTLFSLQRHRQHIVVHADARVLRGLDGVLEGGARGARLAAGLTLTLFSLQRHR